MRRQLCLRPLLVWRRHASRISFAPQPVPAIDQASRSRSASPNGSFGTPPVELGCQHSAFHRSAAIPPRRARSRYQPRAANRHLANRQRQPRTATEEANQQPPSQNIQPTSARSITIRCDHCQSRNPSHAEGRRDKYRRRRRTAYPGRRHTSRKSIAANGHVHRCPQQAGPTAAKPGCVANGDRHHANSTDRLFANCPSRCGKQIDARDSTANH